MKESIANREKKRTGNLLMILGITIVYTFLYFQFYGTVGDPIAALSFIPIGLSGWYLGKNFGGIAGIAFFFLNLFLKLNTSTISTDDLVKSLPPFVISILIGYGAGWLNDFLSQLKKHADDLQEQISENKRIEEEYLKSEYKYKTLVNNLSEIVFKLSYDKRILLINDEWEKLTGYNLEETLDKDFSDFIIQEDRLDIDKLFTELMLGKIEKLKKRVRIKLKNNCSRWFELNGRINNDFNKDQEISVALVDLNELVEVENTLTMKVEFDSVLSSLSANFINIPSFLIEKEIGNAIHKICLFLKADSCHFYLIDEKYEYLVQKSIWRSEKSLNKVALFDKISIKEIHWAINYFRSNKIIYLNELSEIPAEAEFEKKIFIDSNVKSSLNFPLLDQDKFLGFFGFNYFNVNYSLNVELLQSLKSTAIVFINALNRKKNEDEIIKLNRELEKRVNERTNELELSVRRLNSEIYEKAIIEEKLQGKIYRLQFLKGLYEKFEVAIDLKSIFENLYKNLVEYQKVSRVSLLLYDKAANGLISDSLLGFNRKTESFTSNKAQNIGQSISGKCFLEKKVIYIPDCSHTEIIPKFFVDYYQLKSSIAVPILYSNSIKGVLRIDNTELTSAFSEDDLEFFIMVSDILGIVIENAQLFTEYNKMLKELMDGEQRYKLLFDANPHPILVYDSVTLMFLMVNQAAIKMYGYSEEEFKKLTLLDIHPDEEIYNYTLSTKQTTENLDSSGIWRHKLKDGNNIYVEVVSHTITYDNLNAKLLIATNITERKLAEDHLTKYLNELQSSKSLIEKNAKELSELNAKLSHSEKRLTELNANKDKFFSIISHDLRSPFNSILGFSEFLVTELETLSPEEIKTFAGNINKSSRNLVNLLNNVLEWSRVQTGRLRNVPVKFEIGETIDEVVSMIKGNAILKSIEIERNYEKSIEVFADRNAIISVLQNLITNSIKFTSNGGRILLSLKEIKDCAQVEIEDNGIGMKEEELKKLFRIDVTHTTLGTNNEEGTGLGLILCKELVEKNKGEIWVESIPRVKTKFGFTIPLAKKEKSE